MTRLIPSTFLLLLLATSFTACRPRPVESSATPSPFPTETPTTRPLDQPTTRPTDQPTAELPDQPTAELSPRTATIAEAVNVVQAREAANVDWSAAVIGQTLATGGEAQTLAESQARLDLSEGAIVRLGPDTRFTVTELSGTVNDPITRLTLAAGELWVILNTALNTGTFEVETPVGSASVRGSYLNVAYDSIAESVIVSCLEGRCRLRNALGDIELLAGQETSIFGRGLRPDAARPMDPERLERWRIFVREAAPLIEPLRQQLEPLWRDPSFIATREARPTLVATLTLQPGLLQTAIATVTPPPGLLQTAVATVTPQPGLLQTAVATVTPPPGLLQTAVATVTPPPGLLLTAVATRLR